MINQALLSRVVGAVVAISIVSVGLPAFAADKNSTSSWFANQKEFLHEKLSSTPPVTFKFIGNSIVPVFVKQSPKYIVIVEAVDAAVTGAGGTTKHAMR